MPFLQNFSSNRNKALQKWKYACVIDAAHSSNACFWEISFSPWKGLMSLCSDVWAYLLSIYEQSLHLAGYSYQWRYIQLQELVNHCIVRALARFITTVLIVQLSPVFLFGEIESKVSKLKVSRKKMRFIYWILMPYRFLLYAILIQATLKYYHKPKKKKASWQILLHLRHRCKTSDCPSIQQYPNYSQCQFDSSLSVCYLYM